MLIECFWFKHIFEKKRIGCGIKRDATLTLLIHACLFHSQRLPLKHWNKCSGLIKTPSKTSTFIVSDASIHYCCTLLSCHGEKNHYIQPILYPVHSIHIFSFIPILNSHLTSGERQCGVRSLYKDSMPSQGRKSDTKPLNQCDWVWRHHQLAIYPTFAPIVNSCNSLNLLIMTQNWIFI